MKAYPSAAYFCLGVSLGICLSAHDVQAQSPGDSSSWQKQTELRLKAIYEQGEFRPQPFQAEWLADSSGYIVRGREGSAQSTSSVTYDLRSGQPIESEQQGRVLRQENRLLSPDGKLLLEYREGDVYVRDLESNSSTELLKRPADRDARFHSLSWSPDSSRIVFVEADMTNVRQRSVLIHEDPSYPRVQNQRFARVGEQIESLRVGVVELESKNLLWLPIDMPREGCYLGQVEFAGNSQEVLVEKFSRFRDEREFLLVRTSGEISSIYVENDKAWVESSQGKNSGLKWIRDGQAFIVVSEQDGWRHAFLWSRDGKQLALLTPGDYDMIDRGAIDELGGWYYFYASPSNGTQKYLYRVPLDGSGKLQRITPENEPGTHSYQFSPNCKWAFHTVSRIDSPPRVELVELPEHRVIRVLEDNGQLRRRMEQLSAHPTEFLQLDIGGGVVMDAWMLKPRQFDPTKKYPVLVYVYGEPHAQTVLDEWGAAHIDFHRAVADLGYVVVSIDNRGTPAPKGAAWRRSVFGCLGKLSTEEQLAGLNELARQRPFVDLSRVGIWGWSGGGSNTLNAMFRQPDAYHVGIAVVPKPQPHLYNAWFQEIFMRTRELNADGYQQAAAINFADGLKGKLLIVTGSGETNTHIQIIEGLVDRLIELGKAFDYMVYPNRDHGLREGSGTTVHVRLLIIRYLMEHLPAGPR